MVPPHGVVQRASARGSDGCRDLDRPNPSYSIAVEVDIDSPDASGVLFSHGALWSHFDWIGDLGCVLVREGDSMPTTGTLSLFIDDEKVGEGKIITQSGNLTLVGEGLNVGKDPASPVTDDYAGKTPYAFTGGTIKQAVVDVSGDQYVDLEVEALAMMKRE